MAIGRRHVRWRPSISRKGGERRATACALNRTQLQGGAASGASFTHDGRTLTDGFSRWSCRFAQTLHNLPPPSLLVVRARCCARWPTICYPLRRWLRVLLRRWKRACRPFAIPVRRWLDAMHTSCATSRPLVARWLGAGCARRRALPPQVFRGGGAAAGRHSGDAPLMS
ncbi:vesicle coat complex COPII, subunit Sec24 [Dorcoceras hygrometricum]|uniref:Vesicle coat complex COPII, subunit Sec24 n=1 Tax=Dorcoceras hygrometricum TaxID=472368 RepID=A0A2Z6ZX75_9LAMI|nr:vesicle coat complex COPII, subunit Sec24 [Dorcoceras hygrometricum]